MPCPACKHNADGVRQDGPRWRSHSDIALRHGQAVLAAHRIHSAHRHTHLDIAQPAHGVADVVATKLDRPLQDAPT